jgi:oligogalacturonide lyase
MKIQFSNAKTIYLKKLFLYSFFVLVMIVINHLELSAQEVLETGGQSKMPDEWIDKDTHHKVIRLTRREGSNSSFYFHNDPFITQTKKEGDRMVFYGSVANGGRQAFTVNLNTLGITQITNAAGRIGSEIAGHKSHTIYYQLKDSVFAVNIDTKQTKLLFVFPADYKGNIATVNADETLLAGAKASDEQKEILKKYPEKSQFFNRIFDAHLPNDLFIIHIKKGELEKIHTENTWLGHVQFSPVDPELLMFCHEGPWEKVDRIWTINVNSKALNLMHKRTMNMEIAGHEFFGHDGKTIWFDLQMPKGQTFFLGGTNLKTGKEIKYQMTRDEWSIHFNVTKDEKMFCGDGGNDSQVAKAKDGMWIYAFRPEGDKFISEKLVMMKHHAYKLEPNVHFSPDEKWVIFRANFEGEEQVYAAEIAKSDK